MEVILCVTGSVAAVEAVKLARELRRQGINVKCFMSDGATEIIHPNAMEFATGQEVVLSLTGKIEHVKYAPADLIMVAPATANVISKLAHRLADNPISTLLVTAMGYNTPIIFIPSMHHSMYRAVSENIDKLKQEGVTFIKPKMDENKAKFPDIDVITLYVLRYLRDQDLEGKKILISVGATFEKIDEVRGITNLSSGKTGVELAKEAFIRGADITLICGHMDMDVPYIFKLINVESVRDMQKAVEEQVVDCDVFISAAAISDFTPVNAGVGKISSSEEFTLQMERAPKIINEVKKIKPEIFLVGFKAEYKLTEKEMITSARQRMKESQADIIVANDVSREGAGFGSDENEVLIINKEGFKKVPLASKKEIAGKIMNEIAYNLK